MYKTSEDTDQTVADPVVGPDNTRVRANRVLIVSDEPDVCDMLDWLDSRFGCGAVVATDFDALQAANSEHEPEVILLGLRVGDRDAVDMLRYLAKRRCRADVVLMGDTDVKVLESAERVGRRQGLKMRPSLQTPVSAAALRPVLRTMGVHARVTAEEIREGLDESQFFPVFQPVVDLSGDDHALIRAEVLARWRHPFHGDLTAAEFIDEAEQAQMVGELTLSLLDQALALASLCRDAGLDLPVSVNVSALTLVELSLPDTLAEIVLRHGLENGCVTIELTESSVTQDSVESLDVLTRLRLMGFELSMDDFGTGYSTLLELVRLPFNEIKIDRRFVDQLGDRRDCDVVIGSTISLAHGLGLKVCAEGVESLKSVELLKRAGCDAAQGRYFQEPVSGDELVIVLKEWANKHRKEPALSKLMTSSRKAPPSPRRREPGEYDSVLL